MRSQGFGVAADQFMGGVVADFAEFVEQLAGLSRDSAVVFQPVQ
jgi:hypothetical protein